MSKVISVYIKHISNNYLMLRYRYYLIFLLFVVWPFGAFLYAIYYYNERESKIILILFTALFGYSLVAESQGLDLYRVMQTLSPVSNLSFAEFRGKRITEGSVDLYRDMITFLVSRFTANSKWLFFTFGIIAGYFYTRVLSLFISSHSGRNIYKYILIFSFSCILGIDTLGGVRMSLAAYVFFYSAIKVIVYEDKRYLILAASSILIHFSFLSIFLLLIIFPLIKKYPKLIYLVLILSFILPEIFKDYIIQYSRFLGQGIETRTEMYYNLDSEFRIGSDTSWYIKNRIISMLAFCYLALLITRIKRNKIHYSEQTNNLFFFSLIVLSFVNFTMKIPHFGYRFQFVFLMFSIFYFYKIYTENPESSLISNLVLISGPFSLLMIVYSLRSALYITPLSLYYFSLPGLFIDHSTHSAWTTIFY